MTDLAVEVGAHVINKVIVDPLIQNISDVINLDRNRGVLQVRLVRMQCLLQVITNSFEDQQKKLPELIQSGLESTRDAVCDAKSIILRSRLQQQGVDCILWVWDCVLCKPSISTQIREWIKTIDQLYNDIENDLRMFVRLQKAIAVAQPVDFPPLPVPGDSFEGSDIQSAVTERLQKLLTEDSHIRVICVYGMAGIGKTSLLRRVYKSHKVSKAFFTHVIWVTVSQDYKISNLQDQIAEAIHLQLSSITNSAERKSKLCASLKNKKFLLILDDLWSPLDLQQELGVGFGVDKGSKVVFSTRRGRDITLMREEQQQSIAVQPLSVEEARILFNIIAFQGGHVPEELMDYAKKTADECQGLPLAITVVAASMRGKTEVAEWNLSLSLMRISDPSFPITHPPVYRDLYQNLRESYKDLPRKDPNLQHCFLYCTMYPMDKKIDVDALVRMWIADGLVESREATYSQDIMDLGRSYVKLLIDRGLFQDVNFERRSCKEKDNIRKPVNVWKGRYITVHSAILDMAIYVAEEESFLCRAGQQLKDFPLTARKQEYCERISLFGNQIEKLPEVFICPKLVTLILSENPLIYPVPENFLIKLNSLRVLDLSHSQLESMPTSITQLTLLEFLNLSSTNIKEFPAAICSLSKLQFLDLSDCKFLTSLPREISGLTSLKRLDLSMGREKALNDPTNVMALKDLPNLIELRLVLFTKFDALATIMGAWPEMRHLYLHHINMNYVKYNLPDQMQMMKKLQSLVLVDYIGLKLPNWLCGFQQLERLELDGGDNVTEFPPLERLPTLKFLKLRNYPRVKDLGIGSSGLNSGGFPMLQMLLLSNMPKLRSIAAEKGVLKEGTLVKLRVLKIHKCVILRNLPRGMEKLVNLTAVYGSRGWWEEIVWEHHEMKLHLHKLFKEI